MQRLSTDTLTNAMSKPTETPYAQQKRLTNTRTRSNARRSSLGQSSLQQPLEIRDAQPGDRVPSFSRVQGRVRDDSTANDRRARLAVHPITSNRLSAGDIRQALLELVEPRVQEAQSRFASLETGVVEEGDDAAEDRAGG